MTAYACPAAVQLNESVPLDPRPEYHRVSVRPGSIAHGQTRSNQTSPSALVAYSTGGQRSSRTVSLAGANGLLELPGLEDEAARGRTEMEAGESVMCVLLGELGSVVTL